MVSFDQIPDVHENQECVPLLSSLKDSDQSGVSLCDLGFVVAFDTLGSLLASSYSKAGCEHFPSGRSCFSQFSFLFFFFLSEVISTLFIRTYFHDTDFLYACFISLLD